MLSGIRDILLIHAGRSSALPGPPRGRDPMGDPSAGGPARGPHGSHEKQRVGAVSAPVAQGENEPLNIEGHIPGTGEKEGTMARHRQILATLAVLGALLFACGGGGSSSPALSTFPTPTPTPTPTPPSKTVVWEAPQYFADNTPLVPATDLERFEIYVRQDRSFGPDDIAIATPSPMDNTFNLATLAPPLSSGVAYFVSIRAVTKEGEASDFSNPYTFTLPN